MQLRVGVHAGPVVAAVVGARCPKFSIFGGCFYLIRKDPCLGPSNEHAVAHLLYGSVGDKRESFRNLVFTLNLPQLVAQVMW